MPRQAKTEYRTVYIYLCRHTCFYEGKRWFAGTEYLFNQELKEPMSVHFEAIREEKQEMIPEEELAYDVIGREKSRPSEYMADV